MGVTTRAFCLIAGILFLSGTALAGKHTPYSARGGIHLVEKAAKSWESDAYLIYVENDEDVDSLGTAVRWGYLYFSPSRDKVRAYSVRDGEIVVARGLGFQFEAPPIPTEWIDSNEALAVAERKAGAKYREQQDGALKNIVLMRGAFHEKDPDVTTWTIIYTSSSAPSLFVMVDAQTGKVKRKWSG